MNLIVNGEEYVLAVPSPTVLDLLESLGITQKKLAVEHNREIVPKASYDARSLDEGDTIEIVHFIGGG
jgi:thiamine biosynthesis protein ThiS